MMKHKIITSLFVAISIGFIPTIGIAGFHHTYQPRYEIASDTAILSNPVDVRFIKRKLSKSNPKLILTPEILKRLKQKVKTDPVVKNMYAAFQLNAAQIMQKPLLEHIKKGKRLLGVSREMLYRMNILGLLYAVDEDKNILERINQEVVQVCSFKDWNPTHFLDVGEMSLAVAIALDWTKGDLPKSTIQLAKNALIELGLKPSYSKNRWWINVTNNWNQVCNTGMIAASIATADVDPDLAAKTISRALNGMPNALKEYAPDGVYPEGSTYWVYGTSFTAIASSMMQTAFGTDFGLSAYQPLLKSADFRLLSIAPSGWYYNFSDCGSKRGSNGDLTLVWFADQTGDKTYFERDRFLRDPQKMGKLSRLAGAGLVWISEFKPTVESQLPLNWKGGGDNPVVFFRGGDEDPHHYYFGAKGGQANHSHGNMDAGSFVFELNGVRWVVDPGSQDYYEVEKTGFDLWGSCQTCDRWTLLTKNNFGHSTVTINEQYFNVEAYVPITSFHQGKQPEASMDMTKLYNGAVKQWTRTFSKPDDQSLVITDQFKPADSTRSIRWQLVTQAAVTFTKDGLLLQQDGKQLRMQIIAPEGISASVTALNPPPLAIDKKMTNLKRIDLNIPAWTVKGDKGTIKIKLSAE